MRGFCFIFNTPVTWAFRLECCDHRLNPQPEAFIERKKMESTDGKLRGSCHCGAVRFQVQLTDGLKTARRCNCSYCRMICSPPEAVRVDQRADGACNRACRGRWDWGRYAVRRGGGWHAGRVDTSAFPLNLVVFPQVLQHGVMDALPATRLLPGMQAPPATHAAAATQFTGKVFPRQTGLEDEQDAGQGGAVVNARTPAFGRRTMCW